MAAEVFDFEGAGERYKFLLQPVKDLASNWDLDIAKALEDYIHRMVEENDSAVLVDRNGRRKVFNFAEAAMLIHGSTTVYVKKVEYVHQIALNFFDQIKEDKQLEKKRQKGAGQDNQNGIEEGGEDGDGDENNQQNENVEETERRKKQKNKFNHTVARNLLERLTLHQTSALPLVPIAFVPLSDFEKTDVPLFTRTNNKDQIGKKDDFRINSCHIHESIALLDLKHESLVDQFAQKQGIHHDSHRTTTGIGCHTLEPVMECSMEDEMDSHMNLSDSTQQQNLNLNENGDTSSHNNTLVGDNGIHDFDEGMANDENNAFDAASNDNTLTEQQEIDPDANDAISATNLNGHEEMENHEQEIPSNPDSYMNDEIGREPQISLAQTTATNQLLRGSGLDILRPSTLLSRPVTSLETSAAKRQSREANWEELLQDHLDPMELVNEQSKAHRKKLNCVTNATKQIKARDRRIERECLERGVPNENSVKSYIDTQMFRKPLKKQPAFLFGQFNTFLMDQAVVALNPLIYDEEKRRIDLRKKQQKEQQAADRAERAARRRTSQRSLDPVLDHPNEDEDEQQQRENDMNGNAGQLIIDEEDQYEDGMEELIAEEILPGMDDIGTLDDDDQHTNLGDILDIEDLQNSLGGIQNMYIGFEHLVSSKIRDKNALASKLTTKMPNVYDDTIVFEAEFNPDEMLQRPPSQMDYDEIISYHLQKYWAASGAAMTKFSESIQLWESKMTIALEEEQQHREFDTRQYGDELLSEFGGNLNSEIDFSEMLSSVPNEYDRSRYLLVSLILANMGNLEIDVVEKGTDSEERMDEAMDVNTPEMQRPSTSTDQIRLKLLKLERHHRVFDDEQRLLTGNPLG